MSGKIPKNFLILFLLGLVSLACASPKENVGTSKQSLPSPKLQKEARKILLGASCRKCHDSRLETSIPKALAIYDLSVAHWNHEMSAEEYQGALRRIERFKEFSEQERLLFRQFVESVSQKRP